MKTNNRNLNRKLYCKYIVGCLLVSAFFSVGCSKLNLHTKSLEQVSSESGESEDLEFHPILSEFDMVVKWGEKSYGYWKKTSNFNIKVTSDYITTKSTRISLDKISTGEMHRNDSEITSKVSSEDKMVYTKSKDSMDESESEDSNYQRGSYAFLFVDDAQTSSDMSAENTYTFSSPVPLIPRSDLTKSKYKEFSSQSFNYTYTTDDKESGKKVTFKMSCDFTVSGSTKVEVNIKNIITSGFSAKEKADIYGRFPILKETKYIINTKKRQITSFTAKGETLISGLESRSDRLRDGNVGSVDINATLTSYEVGEDTE